MINKNSDKMVGLMVIASLVVAVSWLAVVIFIGWHFLSKFW